MKRVVLMMAGLLLVLGMAGQSSAQQQIKGSDTLYNMTTYMLNQNGTTCGGGSIVYMGGGSGAGYDAMKASTQDIAPMSSDLGTSKCKGTGFDYTTTATSYRHSLDAISMYRTQSNFAPADNQTCSGTELACEGTANSGTIAVRDVNGTAGVDCPGCSGTNYVFADWKDVLAVAYFGKTHDGTSDCNSDVRWALAGMASSTATGGYEPLPLDCQKDCWENFFMKDNGLACTDEKCNVNWHLWRRGDKSGTSDTFSAFFGLKPANFCNGTELQDNDPIRRPVHPNENIPGKVTTLRYSTSAADCTGQNVATSTTQTLGWLLPIVVPPTFTGHNSNACVTGVFDWKEVSLRTNGVCDDLADSIFGLCLVPMDSQNHFGCANNATNPAMFTPLGTDTRVTNLVQRNTSGAIVLDENGLEEIYAYYNIHSSTAISTYVPNCNHDNSTDQIACLTAASPCSVGYAGMGADLQVPETWQLEVNGVQSATANIRDFSYPMTRWLYLASLKGFANVTGAQDKLADCFGNRAYADAAAEAAGFVTIDNTHSGSVPVYDPCP